MITGRGGVIKVPRYIDDDAHRAGGVIAAYNRASGTKLGGGSASTWMQLSYYCISEAFTLREAVPSLSGCNSGNVGQASVVPLMVDFFSLSFRFREMARSPILCVIAIPHTHC